MSDTRHGLGLMLLLLLLSYNLAVSDCDRLRHDFAVTVWCYPVWCYPQTHMATNINRQPALGRRHFWELVSWVLAAAAARARAATPHRLQLACCGACPHCCTSNLMLLLPYSCCCATSSLPPCLPVFPATRQGEALPPSLPASFLASLPPCLHATLLSLLSLSLPACLSLMLDMSYEQQRQYMASCVRLPSCCCRTRLLWQQPAASSSPSPHWHNKSNRPFQLA